MICVREVTKRFADVVAVQDLSLPLRTAPLPVCSAPTARARPRPLKPDAGAIAIWDANSREDAVVASKCVGTLLDHIGLYPRLTARETLVYFARLHGLRGAELERRVERVSADLVLREIADRRTGGFSQGQRMKAALGRALIHEPRHILLDEPTNALDVPAVRSLRGVLRRYREAGACVVLSSHVLGEVEDLCDRIVVLAKGSVAGKARDELCAITETDSLEGAFIALT